MLTQSNFSKPQLKLLKEKVTYTDLTDLELVQACQLKNEQAFNALIKRHERLITGLIYQLAPDWQSQHDDMAQEVYIRVWRSIGSLKNPKAFKSWLKQLITNHFYDLLRKRPRLSVLSLDEPMPGTDDESSPTRDIPDTNNTPHEMMERNEIVQHVSAAIRTLPVNFQNVLVLREFHGLQYDQIATITKTEVGTVKSRIARARAKIQVQLNHLHCA